MTPGDIRTFQNLKSSSSASYSYVESDRCGSSPCPKWSCFVWMASSLSLDFTCNYILYFLVRSGGWGVGLTNITIWWTWILLGHLSPLVSYCNKSMILRWPPMPVGFLISYKEESPLQHIPWARWEKLCYLLGNFFWVILFLL